MRLCGEGGVYRAEAFDPNGPEGPSPSIGFHLNNVHVDDFGVFAAGLKLPALLQITTSGVSVVAELPPGTHNASPFRGGVLLNDTDNDQLVWFTEQRHVAIDVPAYPASDLLRADADASGIARASFARGLCVLSDNLVAGGSSPMTVSVYDLSAGSRIKSVNLTMDVRNAAHGLAVWPF